MAELLTLWLPILLSTLAVFIASSLVWMVLPHHRSDWKPLPNEDAMIGLVKSGGVAPGQYIFPHRPHGAPKDPELERKMKESPWGMLIVVPPVMAMGKRLGSWFLWTLVVSIFCAYIATHSLPPGAGYPDVFRIVGSAAMLAYALGVMPNAVWWGWSWSSTWKHVLDGVLYALLTAGVFGWLWPA